jgi:hypothetical protein
MGHWLWRAVRLIEVAGDLTINSRTADVMHFYWLAQ